MSRVALFMVLFFSIAFIIIGCEQQPLQKKQAQVSRSRSNDNIRAGKIRKLNLQQYGEVWTEENGCPHECCSYHRCWIATTVSTVFAQVGSNETIDPPLQPGTEVCPSWGMLITLRTGHIETIHEFGSAPYYCTGDEVEILFPSSDVKYNLYFLRRGKDDTFRQEWLGAMNHNRAACKNDPKCPAWIRNMPVHKWWVRIDDPPGWISNPEDFTGALCK